MAESAELDGVLKSKGWSESELKIAKYSVYSSASSPGRSEFKYAPCPVHCRHLSSEGLAQCMETCKEKGWKHTARNLEKAALDVSKIIIA